MSCLNLNFSTASLLCELVMDILCFLAEESKPNEVSQFVFKLAIPNYETNFFLVFENVLEQNSTIRLNLLKTLSAWMSSYSDDEFLVLLDFFFKTISNFCLLDEMLDQAFCALSDVLESPRKLHHTICTQFIVPFIRFLSLNLRQNILCLSRGFCAVLIPFTEWISKNPIDELSEIPKIVFEYAQHLGYPGADQEVSETPFALIVSLQESTSDNTFETLFCQIAESLMNAVTFPQDEIYNQWNSDQKQSWISFRISAKEIIESCFLVSIKILDLIHLNLLQENALYLLSCLDDLLPQKNLPQLELILGKKSSIYTNFLKFPKRTKQTLLSVIGKYAFWFWKHEVDSPLEILLQCLTDPTLISSSTMALKLFCTVCGSKITNYFPSLLNLFYMVGITLPQHEKQNFLESLALICQHLPTQDAQHGMEAILGYSLSTIQMDIQSFESTSDKRLQLLDSIAEITSICRGFQTNKLNFTNNILVELSLCLLNLSRNDVLVLESTVDFLEELMNSESSFLTIKDWIQVFEFLADSGAFVASSSCSKLIGFWVISLRRSNDECIVVTKVLNSMLSSLNQMALDESSDLIFGFFSACSTVLSNIPQLIFCILPKCVDFACSCLTLNEPQSLKSSAVFLSDFYAHKHDENIQQLQFLTHERILQTTLTCIFSTATRSVVSFFSDLIFRIKTKQNIPAREFIISFFSVNQIPNFEKSDYEEAKNLIQIQSLRKFKDAMLQLHLKAKKK